MGIMYGWKWADGVWRTAPELGPEQEAKPLPKPKPKPQGFLKGGPDAARQAALARDNRAYHYLVWLDRTFTEPTPARIVLELGKRQGFSVWGLRLARIRLGVRVVRAGGKGTGRRNPWLWQFPVAK